MRETAATAQEVVSRARELLAATKSRKRRETLRAVIGIFDADANTLQVSEPQENYCLDPGPAGFNFSEL